MSQPMRRTLLDEVTTTGPGDTLKTRAHPQFAVFLKVEGIDPEADALEFRLEVSPDDEFYAPVDSGAPNIDDIFFIDDSDLTQSDADPNVYTVYLAQHNQPVEYVRPNLITNSAGATVTAEIYVSGWTQRGTSFDYLSPSN